MTLLPRAFTFALLLCALPAVRGQEAAPVVPPAQEPTPAPAATQDSGPVFDVVLFRDGDRSTGEVLRVERGAVIFRSNRSGEMSIEFEQIADLRCQRRFAVLRKGVRVSHQNAVIGKLELKGEEVIVTPEKGAPIALKAEDVAWAIDDDTFEREVARKVNIHEGWAGTVGAGASFIRSTQNGIALNSDLSLIRTIPGVDYLPRRNRTEIGIRDNFEIIKTSATQYAPEIDSETHIFHAEAERDEYLHSRFFALGAYNFERNYAQGLLAEQIFGAGVGWTAVQNYMQELTLKTDLHRETQAFTNEGDNDTLFGQKFTVEYQRSLSHGVHFHEVTDYLAAYNLPHRYSANTAVVISVPLFSRFGVSFTTTDNYLNNPTSGFKRNSFRFSTSLTYTHSGR